MQEKVVDKIEEVVTQDIWSAIKQFLDMGWSFGSGDHEFKLTVGLLLLIIIAYIATGIVLKWVRRFFTHKMEETDKLKFISVFKFIKYIVYIIVLFAILSVAGVNVTPFLAASAALFIGLGLALQELFQDVIGGVFIIVDKSLLVGDIIEVNEKVGRVIEIKLRTTRAITRDDKIIIIPNHLFITEVIYNYTQNRRTTREFVSVGVAYGSDTLLVEKLLLESLMDQKGILKSPKPFVLFQNFGDSSLDFSVFFFLNDSFTDPFVKSAVRFKIDKLFRENNISIPFPQRDVHIFNTNVAKSSMDSDNMAID